MFSNRKFLVVALFLSFSLTAFAAEPVPEYHGPLNGVLVDGNGNPVNPQPTPGINRNRTRPPAKTGRDVIRLGRKLSPKPSVLSPKTSDAAGQIYLGLDDAAIVDLQHVYAEYEVNRLKWLALPEHPVGRDKEKLNAAWANQVQLSLPLYRIYGEAFKAAGFTVVKKAPQPNGDPSKPVGVLFTVQKGGKTFEVRAGATDIQIKMDQDPKAKVIEPPVKVMLKDGDLTTFTNTKRK